MKRSFVFAMAVCCGLCACQKVELEDEGDDGQQVADVKTKEVQFVMAGIKEEYSTKATIQSENMTDLWVWEGNRLLKHQVSTDADFGVPTLKLTYGGHDLTFVASKADGQTWNGGVWSTTKEWDTYGKVMNVTVSGGSSSSRQVQLTRRSAKVKFVTTDAVPADVQKMHLTVGNHRTLDAQLAGGGAYSHEGTVDMTAKVGSTYMVAVSVLTASATDEEDCAVMIEFLGAGDLTLYHYERVVKLKPNRCVSLTGNYFSGDSNSVTIASAEWDNVEQNLFPTE